MVRKYADWAVQSVLKSEMAFCKFLSANDTGATGGHQSGILISKSAVNILFTKGQERNLNRTVKIEWQEDFVTESSLHIMKVKMN